MSKVLDELREEHRRMAALLDLLAREVTAFEAGELPDYDLVDDILDYSLAYPDLVHHPKEDLIHEKLWLRNPESVQAIGNLEAEHEKLGQATRRFAAAVRNVLQDETLPRDWFLDIAADYLRFARRHMQMEEVVFFPAALKHLTADDWRDIADRAEQDPADGGATGQRYTRLFREITGENGAE